MKKYFYCILFLITILFSNNYAQLGFYHPDSLQEVTLIGTVILDSTHQHDLYYLDTDNNGEANYFLNFGPYWYDPDSSDAVRPNDGDQVTIKGGLHEGMFTEMQVVIVYEIDGLLWREPFDPKWNYMGRGSHWGGRHMGDCRGYAFGWMHDSIKTVQLSGIALVDTTLYFEHYFLDVDSDSLPDYYLNFGPYWYEPESGAKKPNNLDSVKIVGGMVENNFLNMVIVYEINDSLWRDTLSFGTNFTGNWIHKNMGQMERIHSPFDSSDWVQINPGWGMGGMGGGGGMMMDSLFVQFLELYPHNIPNPGNLNIMSGYEFGAFGDNDSNLMWQEGKCGGHMKMGNQNQFQLHYTDKQLNEGNFGEGSIQVMYWDDQSSNWVPINNIQTNTSNNTVLFSTDVLSNYFVITANQTAVSVEGSEVITNYSLEQNYPNPFNPVTIISFTIPEASQVELSVFDMLGRKVATLVNGIKAAGKYNVQFDASNLSSGIYLYTIKSGDFTKTNKMILMK